MEWVKLQYINLAKVNDFFWSIKFILQKKVEKNYIRGYFFKAKNKNVRQEKETVWWIEEKQKQSKQLWAIFASNFIDGDCLGSVDNEVDFEPSCRWCVLAE